MTVPLLAKTIADLRETLARCAAGDRQWTGSHMGAASGHLWPGSNSRRRERLTWSCRSSSIRPVRSAEDFSRYPRPFEHDLQLWPGRRRSGVRSGAGGDVSARLFAPSSRSLRLQDGLCGASRPGHFRGVATVVLKLFQLVQPERAYFGQKDAQQVRIIEQLIRRSERAGGDTSRADIREADGLALSWCNQYLDAFQRQQATVLSRALREVSDAFRPAKRDAETLGRLLTERIGRHRAVLDYAAVVAAESFSRLPPPGPDSGSCWLSSSATRLIDNVLISLST